jgi:hypothetical protein
VKFKSIFTAATVVLLFLAAAAQEENIWAQSQSLSVGIHPGLEKPLGASSDYFTLGGSLNIAGEYGLIPEPLVFLLGGIDYNLNPIKAEQSLSILAASAGVGISLDMAPRFSIQARLRGGYYYATFNDFTMGDHNPFVCGGIGFDYLLSPAMS